MVVFLSFEKFLEDDSLRADFNSARYARNFKERQNISKNRLDPPISESKYLKVGDYFTQKYDESAGFRNIVAISLTYDILLSIYDGNSGRLFIRRFTEWSKEMEVKLERDLALLKVPNFELRLIGLQNGQSWKVIADLIPLIKKRKFPVFEVDLFGEDVRHVSIDAKTGTSMDVLINNRLYKPGELRNNTTFEQFERNGPGAGN
jgi:hypothetical protein